MNSKMNDNLLGVSIKNARLKKKFSQETLAELLDITPTHIKHIESGRRKPSIEILFKLAEILDFSIDNIIFSNGGDKERLIKSIDNKLCTMTKQQLMLTENIIDAIKKSDI